VGETVKKQFLLEGLHCANCANKIEKKVANLNAVKEANMNFANKTLNIEIQEHEEDISIGELQKLVDSVEDGVKVVEKNTFKPLKLVNKISVHKTIRKTISIGLLKHYPLHKVLSRLFSYTRYFKTNKYKKNRV